MGHARPIESSRWPHWLCPVALLLVSWIWVAALTLRADPRNEVVAVIFPPWWSAERAMAAAAAGGASIIRAGGLNAILIAQPSAINGLERLRDAGAWLVVNSVGVGACLAN